LFSSHYIEYKLENNEIPWRTFAGFEYAKDFRSRTQMLEQEMGDISDSQRGLLCIGIALERFRKFY